MLFDNPERVTPKEVLEEFENYYSPENFFRAQAELAPEDVGSLFEGIRPLTEETL